jgi:uncharacterized membrane protein
MKQLKNHLFKRFHILLAVVTITGLSLVLLLFRIKLTHSYFSLFLVWNLFLATIPFLITSLLSGKSGLNKYALILWFGIWLLFLPNAPYIVTDLIHLGHLKATIVLDTVIISACAVSGLLFYFISVRDMELLLRIHFSEKRSKYVIWVVPFLVGFGIYLGRFLRWNSWDVVQRPHVLIQDIWEILSFSSEHKVAWLITFSFGMSLSLAYVLFKRMHFLKLKE